MDPNSTSAAAMASTSTDDADDWDTEGFMVPNVLTGNSDTDAGANPPNSISAGTAYLINPEANEIEEKVHLEPDCPESSCDTKQLEPSRSTSAGTGASTNANASRKQKMKHKLREADKKFGGQVSAHENRIESLREIMGGGVQANDSKAALKGSSRDWLDPHCHESEFDRHSR